MCDAMCDAMCDVRCDAMCDVGLRLRLRRGGAGVGGVTAALLPSISSRSHTYALASSGVIAR